MLKKYIDFLKKHPLITAVIAIVYAMVCLHALKSDNNFNALVLRSLLCGAMAFFLYQISGEKTLTSYYNSTWYVIKIGIGFWIVAFIMGFFGLLVSSDNPVQENILLNTITLFFLFLFVGLFEEMAFRAIINDAIIYQFRDKKYVFVLSALTSFLAFGIAHIVGTDLSTPMAVLQAIGKIAQTGIFGLSLLFLYWKTRNIWACGVVHGVYDFLLSMRDCLFVSPQIDSYIASGDQGKAFVLVYCFFTLIGLFIFWSIYRKIGKKIDYEKIREEW